MRERRHHNGNSNLSRSAPASSQQSNTITSSVPSTSTPLSSRITPPSATSVSDNFSKKNDKKPSSVNNSGAQTARRAEASVERVAHEHGRRLKSAREHNVKEYPTANAISPRGPIPVPKLDLSKAIKHPQTPSGVLPKLHHEVNDKPSITPSNIAQVQWAFKRETTPSSTSYPENMHEALQDFANVLRDRYADKRSLRRAFLNWDRNKDGQLTSDEIRHLIHALGYTKTIGTRNIEEIVSQIDQMPTKSIYYKDFSNYVYGQQKDLTLEGQEMSTQRTTSGRSRPSSSSSTSTERYTDREKVLQLLRSKYQKRKLRSVFRDWDFDKSGALDLKELEANIKRQGVHLSPEQMKDLFDSHDTDKDGKLFYWEFIQMIYGPIHHEYFNTALRDHLQEIQKNVSKNTLRQDPMTMFRNIALENAKEIDDQAIQMTVHEKLQPFEKRINDVFCHFDADRSGRLSYNEFRTGLKHLGAHLTEKEFVHLTKIVDHDSSGEITFSELNKFVTGEAPGNTTDKVNEQNPQQRYSMVSTSNKNAPVSFSPQDQQQNKVGFDFTQLTRRRNKVPTRYGCTPFYDTKQLLTGEENVKSAEPVTNRFQRESQLYGYGVPIVKHPNASSSTNTSGKHSKSTEEPLDLGKIDKAKTQAYYVNRLDRIRHRQEEHAVKHDEMVKVYEQIEERRIHTIQKYRSRYDEALEELNPVRNRCQASTSRNSNSKTTTPIPPDYHRSVNFFG